MSWFPAGNGTSNPWGMSGDDMNSIWSMPQGTMGPMGGSPFTYIQPNQRSFAQQQRAATHPALRQPMGGSGDIIHDFGPLGPRPNMGPQNPWVGSGGDSGPSEGGGGEPQPGGARSVASSLPSGSRPGGNIPAAAGSEHVSRVYPEAGDVPPVVGGGSRGGEGSIHVGESATSRHGGSVAGSRHSGRTRASRIPGSVSSGPYDGGGAAGLHQDPGMQARQFNAFGFPRGRGYRRGYYDWF